MGVAVGVEVQVGVEVPVGVAVGDGVAVGTEVAVGKGASVAREVAAGDGVSKGDQPPMQALPLPAAARRSCSKTGWFLCFQRHIEYSTSRQPRFMSGIRRVLKCLAVVTAEPH